MPGCNKKSGLQAGIVWNNLSRYPVGGADAEEEVGGIGSEPEARGCVELEIGQQEKGDAAVPLVHSRS